MARAQLALSELLDATRADGSIDVLREAMALMLQKLIELEAAQAMGAARYERTGDHGAIEREVGGRRPRSAGGAVDDQLG